jgi:hypothetical protein
MKAEPVVKLMELFDAVAVDFCKMVGATDYDAAMAIFIPQVRAEGIHFAFWVYGLARKWYPMNEPDSVLPERFVEILGLIDSKTKVKSSLASLPDEAVPQIEAFLSFVRRDLFPTIRESMFSTGRLLPFRHIGGRPTTRPDDDTCREICKQIDDLRQQGVKLGVAQQRIVERYGFKLRSIQRVWRECPQNPKKRVDGTIKS